MNSGFGKHGSKLPTPSSKRPALSVFNNENQNPDVKRSRLDLNVDNAPVKRAAGHLRRSKSVTSLNLAAQSFQDEIKNTNKFKKPATVRSGNLCKAPSTTNLSKAPSTINLSDKGTKPTVSAPTSKTGKRPAWDLKGKLEDVEIKINSMQKANATQNSTIDFLREQVMILQETNKKEKKVAEIKSTESQELALQIQSLKSQIETKDDLIHDFEVKKLGMTNEIGTLKAQVQMRDEQIEIQQKANFHLTHENNCLKTELAMAKSQVSSGLSQIEKMSEAIAKLEKQQADLQETLSNRDSELVEAEKWRRKLHNEVQELKGNIRVFCRVRPHRDSATKSAVSFGENQQQLVLNLPSVNNKPKQAEFSYDKVFQPTANQSDVFLEISQLVQSSLDGYNVCIFAYGQTGSGKTYTMEGTNENTGVIARALCQIFKSVAVLSQKGWQYVLKATFLEVYNDTIRDLLAKGRDSTSHEVKMVDGKNDVYVTNLNVVEIFSEDEIGQLLKTAQRQRAVASTMCNDHSSRSHSVFQLSLTGKNETTGESCQGSLNLVDLAGSERLKESQSEGDRLKETKYINKSLSNLGKVIMLLSQKANHIPYRDSKLTHLLMNSLGGNSKTLMFVNISPEEEQLNETLSSLRFATKVNSCQIGVASQKK